MWVKVYLILVTLFFSIIFSTKRDNAALCVVSDLFSIKEKILFQFNWSSKRKMVKFIWMLCFVVLSLGATSSWKYDRRELNNFIFNLW